MSDHSSRPRSAPTPLCSVFEPLLPLVSLDELTTEEAERVRAHTQDCDWCQRRLQEYGTVLEAVRADLGAEPVAASFIVRPESIMNTREDKSLPDWLTRKSSALDTTSTASTRGRARGLSYRLTTLGAVAAVLLVTLLAGVLFAGHGLFTHGGSSGPAARPTAGKTQVGVFPLPSSPVFDSPFLAVGSDGSLWSSQNGGTPSAAEIQGTALTGGTAAVARISPSGSVSLFSFPSGQSRDVQPHAIAIGSDGFVWAADEGNDALWRIDPHTGAMRPFDLPEDDGVVPQQRGGNLIGLAVEPDGKVWYLTDQGQELGQLDPATGTTTTLIPFDHPKESNAIEAIAATSTSNGILWMLLGPRLAGNHTIIGRFDIAARTLQRTDITSVVSDSTFLDISPAPDGSAWVSSPNTTKIVRIVPDGTFKTFELHGASSGMSFATDAQSNLWYLQDTGDGTILVIRLTPQGDSKTIATLTTSQITPAGLETNQIVLAPDSSVVWLLATTNGPNAKQDAVRIALPA